MKIYPLSSPPPVPGIYALTNGSTGQIYIGRSVDLRRRFQEWRMVLTAGLGVKSKTFAAIAGSARPEDWQFCVVSEFPGMCEKDLAAYEERAIQRISARRPKDILNLMMPVENRTAPPQDGCVAKSVVTDDLGNKITYGQAAAELGVTWQTVKKKLHYLRRKGITQVTLAGLR